MSGPTILGVFVGVLALLTAILFILAVWNGAWLVVHQRDEHRLPWREEEDRIKRGEP
jgi:hypothetical protein